MYLLVLLSLKTLEFLVPGTSLSSPVKTRALNVRGASSILGQGTKVPLKPCGHGQKIFKKKFLVTVSSGEKEKRCNFTNLGSEITHHTPSHSISES